MASLVELFTSTHHFTIIKHSEVDMLLRVCLFDRDGNEYPSITTIDVDDPSNSLQVYDALMVSGVFVGPMLDASRELHYEDLVYLAPHPDEKDTNLVLRIRESETHEDVCNMRGHCSIVECREWYSSNLCTMVNIRKEHS
jgi:hypothetical protein